MSRFLYACAWYLATPLLLLSLLWRSRRQRGYLSAVGERFGWLRMGESRGGRLIWVHAVSVGETRAAEPLVRAWLARHPDDRVLLTHMTPTGRETGAQLFRDLVTDGRLSQAWLAWDYPGATRRMIQRVQPDLLVLMETELWPNLVAAARRLRRPVALINARLSDKSLRKGLRWASLIRPALASLSLVLAQTRSDAERLACLGWPESPVVGNLKFDIEAPASAVGMGRRWRQVLDATLPNRGVVLAASTRDGEEALLLAAWQAERAQRGAAAMPLLVLVPRHPQRFDEVADQAQALGLRVGRRSVLLAQNTAAVSALAGWADGEVLIGDSMGEMFAYYALADVAIIGGSLLPLGGQNLIEACALGVPVLLGPHTFNFAQVSEEAIEAEAAMRVNDAAGAVGLALGLIGDEPRRRLMGGCGTGFARRHQGATLRTVGHLEGLLTPPGGKRDDEAD